MKDTHTWAIEEVDGGPVGSDDVYRCTVCGCCGGGTTAWSRTGRLFGPVDGMRMLERSPTPFLPGAAMDLSLDCATAHEQVSFFVKGYLRHWEMRAQRWSAPLGEQEKGFLRLLLNANKYTPVAVPRVEFYHLVFDYDQDIVRQRTTLDEASLKLVGLGFKHASPDCTKCHEPTTRRADDKNELCYTCDWHAREDRPALS